MTPSEVGGIHGRVYSNAVDRDPLLRPDIAKGRGTKSYCSADIKKLSPEVRGLLNQFRVGV